MRRSLSLGVVAAMIFFPGLGGSGCSEKAQPQPAETILDKLNSGDPEKQLEGLEEARKKYERYGGEVE